MNVAMRLGWLAIGCIAACGEAKTSRERSTDPVVSDDDGGPALTVVTASGVSDACPEGGRRVDTGRDADGDGALVTGELLSSTWLCEDALPGEEPAGGGAPDDVCARVPEVLHGSPEILRLDVAGSGYFALASSNDDDAVRYYARSVSLHRDADGALRDEHGLALLGVPDDAAEDVRALEAVPDALPDTETSALELAVNLPAFQPIVSPPRDPEAPWVTAPYGAGVTIFDATGMERLATFWFARVSEFEWEWHVVVDGVDLEGGRGAERVVGGSGRLTFGNDGRLIAESGSRARFHFRGALSAQTFAVAFGASTAEGAGTDGSTSFAGSFETYAQHQDGYAAGTLTGVAVSEDGRVRGAYTNGQHRDAGRLTLARFPRNTGATFACVGLWVEQGDQSDAQLGLPDTAGRGKVRSTLVCDGCVDP